MMERCDKALDTAGEICPSCFRQHNRPEPVPLAELAELNPGLDQRGLRRLQAFEQIIAEDDAAIGYQDPED